MSKSKYQKPALKIEDQINLMISRGLIIDDIETAKHYLNNINYYHLSGYLKAFQRQDDRFVVNTNFTDVLNLYFFDRKLRLLFLNALERIEKSFKTQFVYHLSIKYGHNYLTEDSAFSSHLEKFRVNIKSSKEPFIKQFHDKYSDEYPPLWILVETLSFGDVLNIFSWSLKTKDRKDIARFYGIGWEYLSSWLANLREIRNICAHYSRLWNRKITKNVKKDKFCSFFRYDNHIFDSIIVTKILLNTVSPTYDFTAEVKALVKEYQIDVSQMGFPENWDDVFNKLAYK